MNEVPKTHNAPGTGALATHRDLWTDPDLTTNDALRQARQYADDMLARLALNPTLADMHNEDFHAFVDIFVNTLEDPERDELCEYIKDCVGKLPADKRPLADRVFFGKVLK